MCKFVMCGVYSATGEEMRSQVLRSGGLALILKRIASGGRVHILPNSLGVLHSSSLLYISMSCPKCGSVPNSADPIVGVSVAACAIECQRATRTLRVC